MEGDAKHNSPSQSPTVMQMDRQKDRERQLAR